MVLEKFKLNLEVSAKRMCLNTDTNKCKVSPFSALASIYNYLILSLCHYAHWHPPLLPTGRSIGSH